MNFTEKVTPKRSRGKGGALLIHGGTIVDGTGAPPQRADLAVRGDTIAEIGEFSGAAEETINACGRIVSPGFIDLHSHSDHLLLINPLAESKVLQGVTCEVGGNCGFSAAPLSEERKLNLAESLAAHGAEVDWQTMGGFLARLEREGLGLNFATLVGHGNLRGIVVGYEDRKAALGEIEEMRGQARRALQEGAFGISAGLIYPPGCYADVEELAGVCSALRGGGFFSIHIRDEGAHLLEAIEEALEVARRSRAPLQLSHLKATGEENWGLVRKALERIENARAEGMEISADVYPYTATNTVLCAVLPDWMKVGGKQAMLARLREKAMLKRIEREWGERARKASQWKEYVISRSYAVEYKGLESKPMSEVCREIGEGPLEVIAKLLLADEGRTEIMRFCLCEEDIEEVLCRPWVMVGSDAAAKDLRKDWGHPHPRGFGTFPRILAEYVRRRGVLSLQEAIRKMTSLPAWRLGMTDRGRIAPRCKADLVIFDPDSIADQATYARAMQPPRGIDWVIVNGVVVARGGELTKARPGRVLRTPNKTFTAQTRQ